MGRNSAELLRRLAEGPPIISDGGMGAQLLLRGWQGPTEDANLHAPETVEEIHRAFVSAGAELILTNTFSAVYREEWDLSRLFSDAVGRARSAAKKDTLVALSLGPKVSWPTLEMRSLISAVNELDVDVVWIETVDPEGLAGFDFVRQFRPQITHPVFVSFVAKPSLPPLLARVALASSVGLNCGAEFSAALSGAREMATTPRQPPLNLRPSAGIPTGEGRSLQWPVPPAAFGDFAEEAAALGARIVGGCCGASPDHIAAIADRLRSTR